MDTSSATPRSSTFTPPAVRRRERKWTTVGQPGPLTDDFLFSHASYDSPKHGFLRITAIALYEHRLPTIGSGGMQLSSFSCNVYAFVCQPEYAVITGNIPISIGVIYSIMAMQSPHFTHLAVFTALSIFSSNCFKRSDSAPTHP
jgi:hypothetical protein